MPPVKKEPEAENLAPAPDVDAAELARLRRIIEDYEAADRQRETGAFTGVARCVNQTCKAFDASLPIALRIEVKEMRSEDTPALVLATSEYLQAVDDADLPCPKCGVHRAIMAEEPPSYAQLAPR